LHGSHSLGIIRAQVSLFASAIVGWEICTLGKDIAIRIRIARMHENQGPLQTRIRKSQQRHSVYPSSWPGNQWRGVFPFAESIVFDSALDHGIPCHLGELGVVLVGDGIDVDVFGILGDPSGRTIPD
jgi:hypothetical protein